VTGEPDSGQGRRSRGTKPSRVRHTARRVSAPRTFDSRSRHEFSESSSGQRRQVSTKKRPTRLVQALYSPSASTPLHRGKRDSGPAPVTAHPFDEPFHLGNGIKAEFVPVGTSSGRASSPEWCRSARKRPRIAPGTLARPVGMSADMVIFRGMIHWWVERVGARDEPVLRSFESVIGSLEISA
jgi:hypothetical protein